MIMIAYKTLVLTILVMIKVFLYLYSFISLLVSWTPLSSKSTTTPTSPDQLAQSVVKLGVVLKSKQDVKMARESGLIVDSSGFNLRCSR